MGGESLAAVVKFDATTGKLLWSDPIAVGDYSGLAIFLAHGRYMGFALQDFRLCDGVGDNHALGDRGLYLV
jgi:hypothetical protein